jgi:mannonate dehydratase
MTSIKLGFGFYRHLLNEENFRFARQCGATHAIVHLVDYFGRDQSSETNQPVGKSSWGRAGGSDEYWTVESLTKLKSDMEESGLTLAGIENFDPAHWYDILLGGPRSEEQLENIKQIIRNLGEVGIPVMGYNFSIAGVASRLEGPFARGQARSVGMDGVDETPIPNGMVWNMIYDPEAPEGTLPSISHEVLWQRLAAFLHEIVPVAEQAGVRLAAHPDDPPSPFVRGQPRLVYQQSMYQRLLDIHPSKANALEFCLGSLAEMTEGDLYKTTQKHAENGDIAYIHFRNVVGKVPNYREAFIDDGDIDMKRIVNILIDADFDGVLIPDHTPLMSCESSWHAGMAYAMGYMKALQNN